MAHEIMFTLPNQPLGKVDAQFTVKKDEQILGTLKISKGTIDRTHRDHAHDNPFRMSWSKFDEIMRDQNRKK